MSNPLNSLMSLPSFRNFTTNPVMSNPAVKTGVRYGLILAAAGFVVQLVGIVIAKVVGSPTAHGTDQRALQAFLDKSGPALSMLDIVALAGLVLNIALPLLAGRTAAREAGTVGSGAVAGAVTALFDAAILLVTSVGFTAIGLLTAPRIPFHYPTQHNNLVIFPAPTAGDVFQGGLVNLVIGASIAAGLGALGGLLGRRVYQQAQAGAMPMGMPGGYPEQPIQ